MHDKTCMLYLAGQFLLNSLTKAIVLAHVSINTFFSNFDGMVIGQLSLSFNGGCGFLLSGHECPKTNKQASYYTVISGIVL